MSTSDQTSEHVQLPVVGVVVPLHNHADFIEDCLTSVAEQDYPAKCCVVIDDGSTDDGYDKVLSNLSCDYKVSSDGLPDGVIAGQFNGMTTLLLQHAEAKGPSAARNTGIKALWSSCHFFGVLDADDEYLPSKLSKSIAKMIMDPTRIGLVYSDVLLYNIKTDIKTQEFRRPYDRLVLERENIISNAPLVNKLALQDVGLYDESLRTCEDWDLWLRITEKYVAVHIPEVLQMYRITGVNATQVVNDEQWQRDWQTVQYKLMDRTR